MTRSDDQRINDILEACGHLAEIVASGRATFDRSWQTRSAAERQLEIIGEAAANLSEQFHSARPHLPLRLAKDLRNLIAHDYNNVDYDLLWSTITISIPQFAADLAP